MKRSAAAADGLSHADKCPIFLLKKLKFGHMSARDWLSTVAATDLSAAKSCSYLKV